MDLPFAAVHQLCAPMLIRLDALPEPQRDALSVALGLTSGEPRDNFLVALAVLSLLAAVAEERPLLCVVDDAQWLDRASSQILGFVARQAARGIGGTGVRGARALRHTRAGRLARVAAGEGSARRTLASCWRRPSRAFSTIACASGSSPRRAATHSRCWSCRGTGAHRSVASGFVAPAAADLARSHRAALHANVSARFPRRRSGCCCWRRPNRRGTPRCSGGPRSGSGSERATSPRRTSSALLQIGADVRFPHPLVRSAAYGNGVPGGSPRRPRGAGGGLRR